MRVICQNYKKSFTTVVLIFSTIFCLFAQGVVVNYNYEYKQLYIKNHEDYEIRLFTEDNSQLKLSGKIKRSEEKIFNCPLENVNKVTVFTIIYYKVEYGEPDLANPKKVNWTYKPVTPAKKEVPPVLPRKENNTPPKTQKNDHAKQEKVNTATREDKVKDEITKEDADKMTDEFQNEDDKDHTFAKNLTKNMVYFLLAGLGIIFGLIMFIYYIKNKRKKYVIAKQEAKEALSPNVKVRVRTPQESQQKPKYKTGFAHLEKRNYADYYPVKMSVFFEESAIENVYFKKDFIIYIYRFFQEFLKSSDVVHETGCYIIGCWELNAQHKYNISLEEVVVPGEDAKYGEYELNFGAEIGISLETTIMNLREKTGRDYVHTSWMHSHPGLGIFLSSHDLIVQNQLTYPDHKNRMVAIVIDNITPDLDMVIFSAKPDGTMNNQIDVKTTCSLEKMYQWAKKQTASSEPEPEIPEPVIDENLFHIPVKVQNLTINSILMNEKAIIELGSSLLKESNEVIGYFGGDLRYKQVILKSFSGENKAENICPLFSIPNFNPAYVAKKMENYKCIACIDLVKDNLEFFVQNKEKQFVPISIQRDPVQLIELKKWTRRKR